MVWPWRPHSGRWLWSAALHCGSPVQQERRAVHGRVRELAQEHVAARRHRPPAPLSRYRCGEQVSDPHTASHSMPQLVLTPLDAQVRLPECAFHPVRQQQCGAWHLRVLLCDVCMQRQHSHLTEASPTTQAHTPHTRLQVFDQAAGLAQGVRDDGAGKEESGTATHVDRPVHEDHTLNAGPMHYRLCGDPSPPAHREPRPRRGLCPL